MQPIKQYPPLKFFSQMLKRIHIKSLYKRIFTIGPKEQWVSKITVTKWMRKRKILDREDFSYKDEYLFIYFHIHIYDIHEDVIFLTQSMENHTLGNFNYSLYLVFFLFLLPWTRNCSLPFSIYKYLKILQGFSLNYP